MADISKIKLPSGTVYDIKDALARTDIENLKNTVTGLNGVVHLRGVTTTAIADKDAVNNTVGYVVGAETIKDIVNGDVLIYNTKEFVASADTWHEFGDSSTLGALAYKDSAAGEVNVTGNAAAQVFTGTETTLRHTVTQGTVSVSGTVTPAGTNAASAVTITPSTTDIYSITDVGTLPSKAADTFTAGSLPSFTAGAFSAGTLPSLNTTVAEETLEIAFSAGTLPSKAEDTFDAGALPTFKEGAFAAGTLPTRSADVIKAWTGYTAAQAAAQTFTGAEANITATGNTVGVAVADITYTPAGTNATSAVTATGNVTVQ